MNHKKVTNLILTSVLLLCTIANANAYDIDQTPEMKIEADKSLEKAWQYFNGIDALQSYDEAFKWFKKSAELGNARAALHVSELYDDKSDYKKSRYWHDIAYHRFRRDMHNGDGYAARQIALTYFYSKNKETRREIGVNMLKKAGQLGDGIALEIYADYVSGIFGDIPPNVIEYYKARKNAAQTGLVDSEFQLGFAYLYGTKRFFDKKYDESEPDPYRNLEKAYYWLQKAAEKGYSIAHRTLANDIYLKDPKRKNNLKALKHLMIHNKLDGSELNFDELSFSPNKRELKTARKMTNEWFKKRPNIVRHSVICRKIRKLRDILRKENSQLLQHDVIHMQYKVQIGCGTQLY